MSDSLIPNIEELMPRALAGCVCSDLKLGRDWAQVDPPAHGVAPRAEDAAMICDSLLAHLPGISDAGRKAIMWLGDTNFAAAPAVELERGPARECRATNNHPLLKSADIQAERCAAMRSSPRDGELVQWLERELRPPEREWSRRNCAISQTPDHP